MEQEKRETRCERREEWRQRGDRGGRVRERKRGRRRRGEEKGGFGGKRG